MSTPLEVIKERQKLTPAFLANHIEYEGTLGLSIMLKYRDKALLQALHDELEVEIQKNVTDSDMWVQGKIAGMKDQQDNLQALMDSIRV